MDALPYTNDQWLEDHDRLVTKVVRADTLIAVAKLLMDKGMNETAQQILALMEGN